MGDPSLVLCWETRPHSGKPGSDWNNPLGPGGAGKQSWWVLGADLLEHGAE